MGEGAGPAGKHCRRGQVRSAGAPGKRFPGVAAAVGPPGARGRAPGAGGRGARGGSGRRQYLAVALKYTVRGASTVLLPGAMAAWTKTMLVRFSHVRAKSQFLRR